MLFAILSLGKAATSVERRARGRRYHSVSKVYKTPVALLPLQGRKYTFSFTFVKFGQKTWSRLVVLEQSHAQETGKHQPVDCLFFKSSFC